MLLYLRNILNLSESGGDGVSFRKLEAAVLRPKKFYKPQDLKDVFPLSEKSLLQNALLCGALYRIGRRKLINIETLRLFIDKVGDLAGSIDGKYCQVKDASAYLGLNEEQTMQISSDARALFKIRQVLLVDKDALLAYVEKFRFTVNIIDIDEVEENARIERRLEKYGY